MSWCHSALYYQDRVVRPPDTPPMLGGRIILYLHKVFFIFSILEKPF